jgi:FAD binding domain
VLMGIQSRLSDSSLQTVGVVGWFTGGGHGPLSSDYGMGADNVLEATVVLPSGEFVTTNACQHPDLFYALRGGGGSTYGIVVSVVMKAHPTPQTDHHTFIMSSRKQNLSSKFWETTAYILSEFPRLKEGGVQGYFGFRSFNMNSERFLSMNWGFYLYNKPNGTAESLFEPIRQRLEKENATVSYFSRFTSAPSFFKQFRKSPGFEPVGSSGGSMGGWLLPRSALTNVTKLAKALEIFGPSVDGPVVCHVQSVWLNVSSLIVTILKSAHVTGHFASPNINHGLDIAMNPAWRDSVVDFIPWHPYEGKIAETDVDSSDKRMTNVKMRALRSLAPNSGAYFNEVSLTEALFLLKYQNLVIKLTQYHCDVV